MFFNDAQQVVEVYMNIGLGCGFSSHVGQCPRTNYSQLRPSLLETLKPFHRQDFSFVLLPRNTA
ncbi:hypothetical protein DPMN_088992 [Dreissena polymorpha]|uniref:Uncharacterized protein n=1 Tax=Dreissena polymorpha TaxID=45954 RepID=A0A9D4QYE1_DREPO|nr:hypothetical protein DPMN_088992 [Dreissena polymorpha]